MPFATYDEQLRAWADGTTRGRGKDAHMAFRDGGEQCVPDFSCCKPELEAAPEIRKAFREADEDKRFEFLGGFLSAAMALCVPEKKVHIAGRGRDN